MTDCSQQNHNQFYRHHRPSLTVYPPVNFIANGKPTKIFVNNKEFTPRPSLVQPAEGSKDDDIKLTATSSPITWLPGRYAFNGLPGSFVYLPVAPYAPAAQATAYASGAASMAPARAPFTWLGSRSVAAPLSTATVGHRGRIPTPIYLG